MQTPWTRTHQWGLGNKGEGGEVQRKCRVRGYRCTQRENMAHQHGEEVVQQGKATGEQCPRTKYPPPSHHPLLTGSRRPPGPGVSPLQYIPTHRMGTATTPFPVNPYAGTSHNTHHSHNKRYVQATW